MTSATTQPILTPLTPAAIFLVLTINDGGEATVHEALTDFDHQVAALFFRVPQANLSLVAGIGSRAWDRLFSGPKPAKLHPFIALTGDRHTAPSTPGDLLLHIRGATADVCFELGSRLLGSMAGAVSIADEVHGFKYFDMRDLLGFVDGTENPTGQLAAQTVRIGDDGSFSVLCIDGGELCAVESVNRPADHMAARKLLETGKSPAPDVACDPAVALKSLI